jgi:RNA polymerase sigma-54 factor
MAQMKLGLGLSQKLGLQLKLAPQIIQSIEILQLPAQSLQEYVETELQENETLERDVDHVVEAERPAPDTTGGSDSTGAQDGTGAATAEAEDARSRDTEVEMLERYEQLENQAERDWQDFGPRRMAGGGEDSKLEAMNNTPADASSLQEALYEQFLQMEPTETQRTIGRHIIFNLDQNGLLGRRGRRQRRGLRSAGQ